MYTEMPHGLSSSANTIENCILKQFHHSQQHLTSLFRQSKSKIHFTFDMWTSPNYRAFLGLVAHWLDSNYKLPSKVISMWRFHGRYRGANQGGCSLEVVKPYSITEKIGIILHSSISLGISNSKIFASIQSTAGYAVWVTLLTLELRPSFGDRILKFVRQRLLLIKTYNPRQRS